MSSQQQDYYSILGVSRQASAEEIKRAYFAAAQKLHPDRNKAAGETELFLEVQRAYETLSNPTRRAQYDATLPPEETSLKLPYEYKVLYSRSSLIRMAEPQMLYFILELEAPSEVRGSPSPPLNVCIVLDRSTSMKGEKMDVVKSTAIQILRSLRPQDILSVVAFSDRAEVIIPAAYHQDRARLEARIQMIQPSGGTEIFQGLDAGAQEVMRSISSGRLNHIILLTDGQTYGDEPECLELAARLGEQGVGISAMGIGADWNDIFLDTLATRTGGSSAFIAQPQDIKKLLLEKFSALAQVYAEEVNLTLTPIEGAQLSYAFRLQPDPGLIPVDEPILRLGPILQDTPTQVIFEYIISSTAVKLDSTVILDGTLKVSIPALPLPAPPFRLRLQRPIQDKTDTETPPAEIVKALSRLMLYRMQERARIEIEKGNVEAGTRQLQALAANLLSQGERSLAQTITLEVQRIQQEKGLSAEGGKKIKYGTRALFLASPK
jgi:Ca-activated chloride channel family protein